MSSGWEEYSLLDAFDVRNGLTKKREEFGFGAPFVAFKDVFNNHFIPEELDSLANTTPKEQKKYSIKRGDVLITRTSENFEELGMTSVALKDYPAAAYNGFTKRLRPKKGIELKPEYLGFFFRSPFFRRQVLSLTTMTTRASLNNEMLARLKIKVPPSKEQDRIAEALLSCHNKIHLNKQTNETLEAMAQAIFKSWFVDFDPVRAKIEAKSAGRDPNRAAMAGISLEQDWDEIEAALDQKLAGMTEAQRQQLTRTAQLFPDELEESEIGEVPKGWGISEIGKEVNSVGGTTLRTKNPEYWDGGKIAWTTPKDLSNANSKILLETDRKITEEGLDQISSGLLPIHTVLMSSRAPVGYLALSKIPIAINQGYIAMICDKVLTPEYVLHWTESNMDMIKQHAGGSTFSEISKRNFRPLPVLVPSQEILNVYSDKVGSFYDSVTANMKENKTLENLRDTFLPKLISGEIQM